MSSAMFAVRKFLKFSKIYYGIINFETNLEYLLIGVPSGPMRNFSKFQAMSVLLTGFQMKN